MLTCPQCQLENPDNNRFCIHCGTSLCHKFCHECGTKVVWHDLNCPICGVMVGKTWRAILFGGIALSNMEPEHTETIADAYPDMMVGGSATDTSLATTIDIMTKEISQERKSLFTPSETQETNDPDFPAAATSSRVSERRENSEKIPSINGDILSVKEPEKPEDNQEILIAKTHEKDFSNEETSLSLLPPIPANTYLDSQQRYLIIETVPERQIDTPFVVTVLDCNPLQIPLLKPLLETESKVPEVVKPYVTLKSKFPHSLPSLHDAWEDVGQKVILMEDCSHWPAFSQQWNDNQVSLEQLVLFLQDMIEFWMILDSLGCRQSLLKSDNLRLSPHSQPDKLLICFQCLYPDAPDAPPSLSDLGNFWRNLFIDSQRTLFGGLAELLTLLPKGDMNDIEEVRSRLQEIQRELTGSDEGEEEQKRMNTSTVAMAHSPEGENNFDEENICDSEESESLPTNLYQLDDAGGTDVGRQRAHNEDCFSILAQCRKLESNQSRTFKAKGLYILCDGMGGHDHGEVASQLAVDTLQRYFQEHWHDELPSETTIFNGIIAANNAIYAINQEKASFGSGRMGTTLVLTLIHDTKVAIAHLGDSRVYRLEREGLLEQLTVDHEVGQREIKRGIEPEIAYSRPDAYQLTQALGPRDETFLEPDIQFFDLIDDTLFVLASDGLTDNQLLEIHWQTNLLPLLEPSTSLEDGVQDLIDLGNEYNGHDNITAIVVRALI
jgi:protein phosphatase